MYLYLPYLHHISKRSYSSTVTKPRSPTKKTTAATTTARMMPAGKVLCVAEKPSIAKAVSQHLSGGRTTVRSSQNKYIKNYDFTYRFAAPWGECAATMTSVLGHTVEWDFDDTHRKWNACAPGSLFDARTVQVIGDKMKDVAANISREARGASVLFIWTDCDREGEYIGTEVRDLALKANPRIVVKRARFSNIERAHILRAAQNPAELDERQAAAVSARIELDLRIGAAFTRWQTLALKSVLGNEQNQIVSYGSCQFPTLGFVVDRYNRVKNFVAEPFWSIRVVHKRDDIHVTFSWSRYHLFDRMSTVILFERCLLAKYATVTSVVTKPTHRWKPLPLTTVELQKLGSRLLGLSSQVMMTIAEKLYISGFISYPRTETDQFDKAIDLRALVEKQTQSENWGQYAQGLLDGGFSSPRNGRNNDKAHPPIHPVVFVAPHALSSPDERRVYEFVVRRFLACCSADALGQSTTVTIAYGDAYPEEFHASGLVVLERNYLDVYVYDKWESSQMLPSFTVGERFVPTEANITEGETGPPSYLTEPELIGLMDANGIGTDATMADHISKITERMYVFAQPKGLGGGGGFGEDAEGAAPAGRGGRGRGRGRGGRGGARGGAVAGGGGRGGMLEFIPSNLGIALVEGYDKIGFENSLSKPFLRKEMEEMMARVCGGTMTRGDMVQSSLEQYREMFVKANRQVGVLQESARKYLGPA